MDFPIPGMENVVATVSGYHGTERFNLIKLISQSGAGYVGAMSQSVTHLVCWKFEGRKYDLAKKLRIIIVNHHWVEECIKQGKRVPEHPYMLQSAKDAGPLLMEASLIHDVRPSNRTPNALADTSHADEKFNCMSRRYSGLAAWCDSDTSKENLFSKKRNENKSSRKAKSKQGEKGSEKENRSGGRYCSQEPSLSYLVGLELDDSMSKRPMHSERQKGKISCEKEPSLGSKKRLLKGKRKISNDFDTTFSDSSFKFWRLGEETHSRDSMDIELLDSDGDFHSMRLQNKFSKAEASRGRTSTEETKWDGVSTDQTFDDIVEIRDMNAVEKRESRQPELVTRFPISEELSCVICWTEFSSSRGVLPCGHRFCYSCIQNWADHMISSRKTSTCPLCKVGFASITKVDGAASSDQKIYSQTLPCPNSATEILLLNDQQRLQNAGPAVCGECGCREPEDLLIMCDHCSIRCIHMYCLDPPLIPWTCIHCKDLQRLLYHPR